jgi:hypothetical protein
MPDRWSFVLRLAEWKNCSFVKKLRGWAGWFPGSVASNILQPPDTLQPASVRDPPVIRADNPRHRRTGDAAVSDLVRLQLVVTWTFTALTMSPNQRRRCTRPPDPP